MGHQYYRPRTWVWISFSLLMLFLLLVHEISYTAGVEYLDGWMPDHTMSALVAWFFATLAMKKWRTLRMMSRKATGKERFSILLNLVISATILLVFAGFIYADAPVPQGPRGHGRY